MCYLPAQPSGRGARNRPQESHETECDGQGNGALREARVALLCGAIALVQAGGLVAIDSIARASNFGSSGTPGVSGTTNGVWLTDNRSWVIGRRDLTSTYSTGVAQAVNQEYDPTDINPSLSSPASCPDADFDLCVFDSDYGDNGLNGWNQCAGTTTGSHPNQVCSLDFVKINLHYSPPAKRIACHEMGHGLGLRHTQNDASCMKSTADGGTSSQLAAHDKTHINDNY